MATRQYIGARYVPKFYQNSVDGSAQWESNVVYEPLTYVTLTNGHMYISKKQVPATVGSPVSNIEYWLDIGSYNGFIEQLQDEIDDINNVTIPAVQASVALKQDITDNNLATTDKTVVGAINEVNTAVGNVNTALADKQDKTDNNLNTTDKTVVGAINELDTRIDNLSAYSGRKFILLGDSLGYGITPSESIGSDTGVGWIKNFENTVGQYCDTYYANVSVLTGVAGFASSLSFLSMLQTLESVITDKDSITDIVVLGGSNDVSGNSVTSGAIESAISAFMTYCRATYPRAHVKIGILAARIRLMHADGAKPIDSYKTCTKYGAEFVGDGIGLYCVPSTKDPDHTHLTQAGYAYYTDYVNNLILSGHCDFKFQFVLNATLDTTKLALADSITTSLVLQADYAKHSVTLQFKNGNRNNAFLVEILDRTLTNDASIIDCITLDDWIDLPYQYNQVSGGTISIYNNTSGEALSGGMHRVFTTDYDKFAMQMSPAVGNRHVGDSGYKTIATITPAVMGLINY